MSGPSELVDPADDAGSGEVGGTDVVGPPASHHDTLTQPPGGAFDLTGKVALVTGGSRGLGREISLGFARAGADLVVASRTLSACEEVAAEARALGRTALAYACHVGRWDELPGLVNAAYAAFGRVDVLVNNAGMSPLYPSLPECTEQLFDAVVNLNLKGPFRLSVLVAERMRAAGGGSIVNVSSVASMRPNGSVAPYAAAKAGLNTLAESIGQAYAPTVRVNTLMAGPFATDVAVHWDDAMRQRLADSVLLGRIGQPGEIVGAALFLASEASSYVTGSVLRIDGGTR